MNRQIDVLKGDYIKLQYYILRLEKEGDTQRLPGFRLKAKQLVEAINKIEDKGNILTL